MINKVFEELLRNINILLVRFMDKNIKIYDEENPDFYITQIEYDKELDKVFARFEEDK